VKYLSAAVNIVLTDLRRVRGADDLIGSVAVPKNPLLYELMPCNPVDLQEDLYALFTFYLRPFITPIQTVNCV
jgi:hypothetical protein